ncbi:GNAT family N-acetyltransferase [Bifidobacterium phasiani]|uniref:GNAT family N-acetyltransferase n=1 Tax=Bifidobacterium phasiani TaxID=2834431 RepID=A0ABS6W9T7_9BIFI|nr:GNAT family N-acetyltransferase [Bifidobacterium phasiani]MBW3083092.1 GNAT family N-acetyltransferase [Bifidobacterium phasiani]
MRISVRRNALTAEIYEGIRETAGFHRYRREDVQAALDGGLFSVVVTVDDVPAGIGRLVGDGRIAFFVKDLVVAPEYRHLGIGSMVLDELIGYVRAHCCEHAYVGLMSTPGKEGFYERHGFTRRPTADLGSGMVRFVDPAPAGVPAAASGEAMRSTFLEAALTS